MRPLPKIPRCCHPQVWGPCLSPPVAGRPLRPATDRRHGGPSPRRPANRTQPPPPAPLAGLSSPPPPGGECTRSCRRFPAGIPRRGAGRSRAPHPSAATRPRRGAPPDLHALGTPPALILSQDQTLHQICTLPRRPPRSGGPTHDTACGRTNKLARGRDHRRARPTPHLLNVPPRPAQRALHHGCVNRTTVRAAGARAGPGSVLGASVVRVCRSVPTGRNSPPFPGARKILPQPCGPVKDSHQAISRVGICGTDVAAEVVRAYYW